MSADFRITRLEHTGQDSITASDTGMEVRRSFFLEPWDAYPEVCEILLGRPEADANGKLLIAPHQHPVHRNLRCVRCEVSPTPQDVSYASGTGAIPTTPGITRSSGFTVDLDGNGDLDMTNVNNAINHRPYYQAAIITAFYANRPDWIVERTFNGENQSLPQNFLQWKNITQDGGVVFLSPNGPNNSGTPAVKRSYYIDIVITPFRHPKAPLISPIFATWGNLVGCVNCSAWQMNLKSNLTGTSVLPIYTFPAETLLFQGLTPRIQTSSNSPVQARGAAAAPNRPISYDYWDHSFRFTFKGTQAQLDEFASPPSEFVPPVGSIYDSSGRGYYVGWNRFLSPAQVNVDAPNKSKAVWDYAVTADGKYAYECAEDVSFGANSGFDLLFNW
jgi:hypothetical protein